MGASFRVILGEPFVGFKNPPIQAYQDFKSVKLNTSFGLTHCDLGLMAQCSIDSVYADILNEEIEYLTEADFEKTADFSESPYHKGFDDNRFPPTGPVNDTSVKTAGKNFMTRLVSSASGGLTQSLSGVADPGIFRSTYKVESDEADNPSVDNRNYTPPKLRTQVFDDPYSPVIFHIKHSFSYAHIAEEDTAWTLSFTGPVLERVHNGREVRGSYYFIKMRAGRLYLYCACVDILEPGVYENPLILVQDLGKASTDGNTFLIHRRAPTQFTAGFMVIQVAGPFENLLLNAKDYLIDESNRKSEIPALGRSYTIIGSSQILDPTPKYVYFGVNPYLFDVSFRMGYCKYTHGRKKRLNNSEIVLPYAVGSQTDKDLFIDLTGDTPTGTSFNVKAFGIDADGVEEELVSTDTQNQGKRNNFSLDTTIVFQKVKLQIDFVCLDKVSPLYQSAYVALDGTFVDEAEDYLVLPTEGCTITNLVTSAEDIKDVTMTLEVHDPYNKIKNIRNRSWWTIKYQICFNDSGTAPTTPALSVTPNLTYADDTRVWHNIFSGIVSSIEQTSDGESLKSRFKIEARTPWHFVATQMNLQSINLIDYGIATHGKPGIIVNILRDILILAGIPESKIDFLSDTTRLNLSKDQVPPYINPGKNLAELFMELLRTNLPYYLKWDHITEEFKLKTKPKKDDPAKASFLPKTGLRVAMTNKLRYTSLDPLPKIESKKGAQFFPIPPEFNYLIVTQTGSTEGKQNPIKLQQMWFNKNSLEWEYNGTTVPIPVEDRGPDYIGMLLPAVAYMPDLAIYSKVSKDVINAITVRLARFAGLGRIGLGRTIPIFWFPHEDDPTKYRMIEYGDNIEVLTDYNFSVKTVSIPYIRKAKVDLFMDVILERIALDEEVILS
jgi:hypothetical protein